MVVNDQGKSPPDPANSKVTKWIAIKRKRPHPGKNTYVNTSCSCNSADPENSQHRKPCRESAQGERLETASVGHLTSVLRQRGALSCLETEVFDPIQGCVAEFRTWLI